MILNKYNNKIKIKFFQLKLINLKIDTFYIIIWHKYYYKIMVEHFLVYIYYNLNINL